MNSLEKTAVHGLKEGRKIPGRLHDQEQDIRKFLRVLLCVHDERMFDALVEKFSRSPEFSPRYKHGDVYRSLMRRLYNFFVELEKDDIRRKIGADVSGQKVYEKL